MTFLDAPAFPEASPFLSPSPSPLFGATAQDQQLLAMAPQLGGIPTFTGSTAPAPAQPPTAEEMLASLTGVDIGDPNTWTPEEAAAQTDNALAKLAQANPELAEKVRALSEERTGAAPAAAGEEDRGFFGDLLHGVGEVLHVTHLDTVFDVLSRPAHIIPELLADEEGDSFWENVGQALTGHSDKGWGQVLDKYDLLQGDDFLSRMAHAGAAFLGDVATDPLTYATFGAAAIGKEALMRTAAEVGFKGSLMSSEEGVQLLAHIGDKGVTAAWKGIVGGGIEDVGDVSARLMSALKEAGVADDALAGIGHAIQGEAGAEALMKAVKAADTVAQHVGMYGAGALRNSTKMQGVAKELGIPLDEMRNMLGETLGKGQGIVAKSAYEKAKAASALMGGGVKFRASIPVFNIRFVTRALPFTEGLNFQMGRRFFAGLSGYQRLTKMLANDASVGLGHFEAFAQGGFSGLRKFDGPVADKLAGGSFLHGGSILYPMSETVGTITAQLSAHAKALRGGGLAELIAADTYRQATNKQANVADAVLQVVGKDGKLMSPEQVQRSVLKNFNVAELRKTGRLDEMWDVMHEYMDLVDSDAAQEMGAKAFYQAQIDQLRAPFTGPANAGTRIPDDVAEKIAMTEEKMKRAIAAEERLQTFGPDVLEGARIHRNVILNGQEQLLRNHIYDDVYSSDINTVHALGEEDAETWNAGGHEATRGDVYTMDRPDTLQRGTGRIEEGSLTDEGGNDVVARGVHATAVDDTVPPMPASEAAAADPAVLTLKNLKDTEAERAAKVSALDAAFAAGEDAEYGYHYTPQGNLEDIRQNGLLPTKPKDMTPPKPEGVYFGESTKEAYNLVPMKGARDAVPLRVKRSAEIATSGPGELMSGKRIAPENIEYLGADGVWHPLIPAAPATSPRMTGRLLNPVVRDLSAGGRRSTSELDIYARIRKEVEAALDAFEQTGEVQVGKGGDAFTGVLDDDVRAIIEGELNRNEKIGELVTQRLQGMGHDGIVTIGEDGRKTVVFFHDPNGAQNIKFLTNEAPRAGGGARIVHQLTGEVAEAIHGVATDGGNRFAGAALMRKLARKLVGKNLKEAEEEARRFLAKEGIVIRDGQRVFETDPLKVASRYSNEIGHRVAQEYLGRTASRLEMWGLSDTPFRGGAVGLERFKYTVSMGKEGFSKVSKLAEKYAAAERRLAKYTSERPALKAEAERLQEQVDRINAALTEKMDSLDGLITSKTGEATETISEEAIARKLVEVRQRLARAGEEAARYPKSVTEKVEVVGHFNGGDILKLKTTEGTFYAMRAPDGRIVGYRSVTHTMDGSLAGGVSALVAPESRGMGIGSALLQKHWEEAGVYAAEDPLEAARRMIEPQDFTQEGADLNRRALRDLPDQLKEKSPLWKNSVDARAKYDTVLSDLDNAQKEVNKIHAKLTTKVADIKPAMVPTENAKNMTGMSTLEIPGFTDQAMPTFMAEEFNRAYTGFKGLHGFHKQYRKFMSWWKTWATWMFPGFHARNIQGAFFNNLLGGVGVQDYVFASRIRRAMHELTHETPDKYKWATALVKDRDLAAIKEMGLGSYLSDEALSVLRYSDLGELLNDIGVNAAHGRAFGEARVGAEHLEEQLGKKTMVEAVPVVGKTYVKAMKGTGSMTENIFRTAAWVRGMKNTGDIWGARAFTMMRHGDYADLTDFEYGMVRDVLPFYKWMRTNMPFQIHQLLESPGKLLAVDKLRDAAWDFTGRDWNKEKYKEPEWMRDSMQIPWPSGGAVHAVMTDLPMNDLFMSGREFMSSFLPIVRPFLESYVTKQSTFTGAPLGSEGVQLDSAFDVLGGVIQAVGLGEKGADGGTFVSSSTANMLGLIPFFSRFRNFMLEDGDRAGKRANAIASSFFGLNYRPIDDDTLTSAELDFYYNEVEPTMTWARSIGYPMPTVDDLAATVGGTDTILKNLGIEPGGVQAVQDTA